MADPVSEYSWIKDVVQFGALGIVAFGAYVLLTKTWPSLLATFTKEIESQRQLHAATLDQRSKEFTQVLESQRKDFISELQAERESNVAATERLTNIFREQQKELIQMRCLRPSCENRVPASS